MTTTLTNEGSVAGSPVPIVPYLAYSDERGAHLTGSECADCGARFVGPRVFCAACTSDQIRQIILAERGTLFNYTIVFRSYPGIAVPFVDAVVALENGPHLKGTLKGVSPDPAAIAFGMPVEVFYETVPATSDGAERLTYSFRPTAV